jgi:hypothetical protein
MDKMIDPVHVWFDKISSSGDAVAVKALLSKLQNYQGTPITDDMIEVVNFISAIRLLQLRDDCRRLRTAD